MKKREGCGLACCFLPFALLGVIVLLTSFNAGLVLVFGTTVPGRITRVYPSRHGHWDADYDYVVRGKTYKGSARVYASDEKQLTGGTPVKVRVFAPWPSGASHLDGHGPPILVTALALGVLFLPFTLFFLPYLDGVAALWGKLTRRKR